MYNVICALVVKPLREHLLQERDWEMKFEITDMLINFTCMLVAKTLCISEAYGVKMKLIISCITV